MIEEKDNPPVNSTNTQDSQSYGEPPVSPSENQERITKSEK